MNAKRIEGKSSTVFVEIGISARKAVEASMDIAARILKGEGKLPKDDYTNVEGLFEREERRGYF